MADNFTASPGAGGDTFAADDVGGVKFPRSKITLGADGVNGGDVSVSNPLPITGSVTASGTVSVSNMVAQGLTDTQLRATAVPVSGTFWQATQPVSGTFWQTTQPVSIATMPSTPVTGTFWQATQPVSAASLPLPTGAATETTLAALNTKMPVLGQGLMAASQPVVIASNQSAVPVSGTFWQTTQPVSIATMPSTPVTGTFWQTTQPVSIATLPSLAAGAAAIGSITNTSFAATQATPANLQMTATQAVGSAATRWFTQISDGTNSPAVKAASTLAAAADPALVVQQSPQNVFTSNLVVTGTAAANTGLTITLPLVAGQFHYIDRIEIVRTATAALTGSATLVVTTTNLPGSLAWSFGNAMTAGGTQRDLDATFAVPLKSSSSGVATTIVMPVPGAAVLWRCNVYYHTGI